MSWTPSPPSVPAESTPANGAAEADVTSAAQPDPLAGSTSAPDIGQLETELRAVDRALARLDDGSYARCEECGATLDDATLAADPTATHCARH